ncbi:tRNA (adenosine(37)-N6)-threonylcarbamoyltransferase complex ATPase subunit type 1 TsaE [Geobacter sp. SVR]|uniref:tRNA (adenosine(37)-N6)-threonylcarbamoyltransferase complex ATPase subunit type 1 TsaE n=1 Tax=Geobacter sp. SVR TaxID=2495594 RepID=UPI00143EFC41|nr:tRNA (adenosine(37)-N6)-threonylcarbamoyltransferase complex ATPase subunit type 1 TsaE [Geobacter sp. SVR]BCS54513.1 tRNA (adenosine(37)-N6)-threonylcarbamoyltransferase complex ATPase subunit type 1 TsaE [Geobacter sp. SVR]GCF87113.1 tRNA (adenosine(37)-N6)-threonylcarbamoyltransferase complex ATPase subunit type 1 TsaE [Geobacter sp. SVR]
MLELISHSPDDTLALGRHLGSLLKAGAFVALSGQLGGGKTCFTRGIVAAVAPASLRLVASPTFAIMNEYPGTPPVYHFDFYRLSGAGEVAELGFEDYFGGHGICIAEWSERLGELLPPDRLEITFAHAGDDHRKLSLRATGTDAQTLLESFAKGIDAEKIILT